MSDPEVPVSILLCPWSSWILSSSRFSPTRIHAFSITISFLSALIPIKYSLRNFNIPTTRPQTPKQLSRPMISSDSHLTTQS